MSTRRATILKKKNAAACRVFLFDALGLLMFPISLIMDLGRAFFFFLLHFSLVAGANEPTSSNCGETTVRWTHWLSHDSRVTDSLRSEARRLLANSDRWAQSFHDGLVVHSLKSLQNERSLVAIPIGNAHSSFPERLEKDYANLIHALLDKGHTLLYDADSATAPWLENRVPLHRRVGLSRKSREECRKVSGRGVILSLSNPFLRLQAYARANHVIASPRSVVGSALIIFGAAHKAFVPGMDYKSPPHPKEEKIKACRIPSHAAAIQSLPNDFPGGHGGDRPLSISVEGTLDSLHPLELIELFQMADQMDFVEKSMDRHAGAKRAVVLGWSVDHEAYRGLVAAMARRLVALGYSVTTGGSGGYMQVANQAAFESGGVSIGIPFVGLQRLANEQRVPSHFHTVTLPTIGYAVRIPGLLYGQDPLVVAPGTSGTLQEVAAGLMETEETKSEFLFLDKEFYGSSVEWLLRFWLPPRLSKRFKILENEKEISEWGN